MNKQKPLWPLIYGLCLTIFTLYVLLDAFVIPRAYTQVETAAQTQSGAEETLSTLSAAVTDDSYSDGELSITITLYRENDTAIYVADVTLASADALKTAFAQNTYGKNITATTSSIAAEAGAILAVNGDYYSSRGGYVIRNGVIYRASSQDTSQEDLVIYADGSFEIITEGEISAQELLDKGAQQLLSFGPALVEGGSVAVSRSEEVDQAKTSNPRTAIGVISPLHYVFVVSDGRTDESEGLSLYELAQFMQELGVETAYNLDGGGSSTMVFNGTVINQPTSGKRISERKVSDIVYIG